MQIFRELLNDESGMIMSAEAVMVGTVGVLGATVGLSAVAQSVNDELVEVAYAFRSLDQSYSFEGRNRCGATVAGSSYTQRPVKESIDELCAQIEEANKKHDLEHKQHMQDQRKEEPRKRPESNKKKKNKDKEEN